MTAASSSDEIMINAVMISILIAEVVAFNLIRACPKRFRTQKGSKFLNFVASFVASFVDSPLKLVPFSTKLRTKLATKGDLVLHL